MEITFKGLNVGDDSNYVVTNIDGWESRPEITNGSTPYPNRLGSWQGALSSVKRVVTVDLAILGDPNDSYNTTGPKRALSRVMNLDDEESPLLMDLGYGSLPEIINCRVTAYTLPTQQGFGRRASASIEFTATDPRRYSVELNTSTTGLPVPLRGMAYPIKYGKFPGLLTPANRGEAVIQNLGNSKSPGVYTITGPVNSPHITIDDGKGRLIRTQFNANLAPNEVLVADSATGTVTIGGAARNGVASGALVQDLELPPGLSTVALGGGGASNAASLTVSYRDANL